MREPIHAEQGGIGERVLRGRAVAPRATWVATLDGVVSQDRGSKSGDPFHSTVDTHD